MSEVPVFADLLRQAREARGLSQTELARKAGLGTGKRTVQDLELKPERGPQGETARRLADALELEGQERARLLVAAAAARGGNRPPAVTGRPAGPDAVGPVHHPATTPADAPQPVPDPRPRVVRGPDPAEQAPGNDPVPALRGPLRRARLVGAALAALLVCALTGDLVMYAQRPRQGPCPGNGCDGSSPFRPGSGCNRDKALTAQGPVPDPQGHVLGTLTLFRSARCGTAWATLEVVRSARRGALAVQTPHDEARVDRVDTVIYTPMLTAGAADCVSVDGVVYGLDGLHSTPLARLHGCGPTAAG